jgi:electron transport complex protein RnfE
MSEKKAKKQSLFTRLLVENPVFGLYLGICSALAITTNINNAIGMGIAVTIVLTLSNILVSSIRNLTPADIHIPVYIVIIATLVTIVGMIIQAYTPSLYSALGAFIDLIVVNCIILGRAEAYASKNGPDVSAFDGLGMGLGFTFALTLAGLIRELIGAGTIFGNQVLPESVEPIGIFVKAPGAFMVFALIIIVQNALGIRTRQRQLVEDGCTGMCATCKISCATGEAVQKARDEKKRMEEEARAAAIAAAKAAKEAKEREKAAQAAAAAAGAAKEGKEVQQ